MTLSPSLSNPGNLYMTPKQASTMLCVAEQTLAQWRWKREGPPYVSISKSCVRYKVADLQAWIDAHTVHPLA